MNLTRRIGGDVAGRISVKQTRIITLAALGATGGFSIGQFPIHAATISWSPTPTDANWTTTTNWVGGVVPGKVSPAANALSADIALFNTSISGGFGSFSTPITNDAGRDIAGFTFDVGADPYTIGTATSNPLQLTQGNTTQLTPADTSPQTLAMPIDFVLPSSTTGAYTFLNNASSGSATFNISSALVSFAGNTRAMNVTFAGTNTGQNIVGGNFNVSAGNSMGIVKSGSGLWILTGNNVLNGYGTKTSAGTVTVNAGTLEIQNVNALGMINPASSGSGSPNSAITIAGGTLQLDATIMGGSLTNQGTLTMNGGTLLTNGSITMSNAHIGAAVITGFATNNSSDVLTVGTASNSLTGGAGATLNYSGPGTLALNQGSNFAGTWSFNSGTTTLGNSTGLGSATGAAIGFGAGSTAALNLNGNSVTVVGLSSPSTSSIVQNANAASVTLTVNNAAANTFSGLLRDGAGGGPLSLSKGGAGALTLTSSNTYSGNTTVTAGSLLVTNTTGSATGPGSVTFSGGSTLGGTGTIAGAVTLGGGCILSPGIVGVSGGIGTLTLGSLTLNSGSALNYDITSTSSLDQTVVTASGGLTINGGTLSINGGTSPFTVDGTYDLFQFSGSLGGAVSSLALNPNNENVTTNSYSFGTSGNFVTLVVGNSSVVIDAWKGTVNSNWSNTGNWTPGIPNGQSAVAAFNSSASNTSVTVDGAYTVGSLTFNDASSYTLTAGTGGTITLDNASTPAFITDSSGSHTLAVPLVTTTSGASFSVANTADTLTVSGIISGSGAGITKGGLGTLLLSGSNTYFGGTTLNLGILSISSDANLGDPSGGVTFGGGQLNVTSNMSSGRSIGVSTANSAVINTASNTLTLSGNITTVNGGTGGLQKLGTGTLILGGANTYQGPTQVTGTLSISSNGNLGDPTIGAGLVLNAATLISTATMALDNSGTGVNSRMVTLNAGVNAISPAATTVLTIDGPIAGAGSLDVTGPGQITILNGTATQNNYSGGTYVNGGTILLGDINSQISGLGTGAVTFNGSAGTVNLRYTTNESTTYGTLANNIVFTNGSTGTLITTPRGDVTGNVTGNGTFNIQTDYVRSQFDYNFTTFTGTLNITPNTQGGDFRMDNTNGFPNNTVNIGTGVNLYDIFNFAAPGGTMPIGALTGTGFLSGDGATNARTVTWSIGGLNTSTGFSGVIADSTGPAAITKVGTGTLTLSGTDTYSGATAVAGGTLALVGGGGLPPAPTLNTSIGTALTITSPGSVVATNVAGTPYAVVVGSLTNTGVLNLNNNLLVINGTTTTLASVNAQLFTGFHNGAWNGTGGAITSGTAAADTSHLTALGAIVNDAGGTALFSSLDGDNALVDGNILVKYTYYGDTNFNGVVDGTDYGRVDNGFINKLTGWYNGDFNYDGVVNGSDYTLMDNAFNSQSAVLSSEIAGSNAIVADQIAGGATAASAVPEPTALGLLGIGALALLGRRNRRRR